jgi:DNA-binding transcriptional LysR family regulator
LAEQAYGVEDQVVGIERMARAGGAGVQGLVRLSPPPAFAAAYLVKCLADLAKAEPGIILDCRRQPRRHGWAVVPALETPKARLEGGPCCVSYIACRV